jgi:phosphate-selective porin OprO/OprP
MKVLPLLAGMIVLMCCEASFAQEYIGALPDNILGTVQSPSSSASQKSQASATQEEQSLENTEVAAQEDMDPNKRQLVRWNRYEGPYITAEFGAGFLYEIDAFAQDRQSKEQFVLHPGYKVRDFRFLLNGSLPSFKRSVTWCLGIMYDGPTNSWLIRQTGLMIAVPELWGNFFIGRSKEGFSLNKVMTGYDGWTMERFTMNDATVPLLADGIKWLGYSPKHGFLWNLGYFNDVVSKGQSFSSYSSQEVARLIWLPQHSERTGILFHVGMNLRYGKVAENQLRLRSRPESFPAPYFLDTGTFEAKSTRMMGPEIYYRRGSWLFGSEYWFENVSSKSTGDPLFHGGMAVVTWLATGEIRPYNLVGGYFKAISPKRPVFQGGPGAWEFLLQVSYTDLNSKLVKGGEFARVTPGVNWHMSDNVRLELEYGYGHLNRFNLKGNTQFFQSRIQLQF